MWRVLPWDAGSAFCCPTFPKVLMLTLTSLQQQLKIIEKNILVLAMQRQSIPFPGCKNLCASPVLFFWPINLPLLSSCYEGHLTLLCGRAPSLQGRCQPCSYKSLPATVYCARVTAGVPPWRINPALLQACHFFLSSRVHVVTANWILNEVFKINALNLGPSLESPRILVQLGHYFITI